MCMIAYRPVTAEHPGANIPNRVIDTAISRHPDGFGVAWREDGKLLTAKFGPSKNGKRAFKARLKQVDKAGHEYVAHFRWATHGPKRESHAHPYEYTDLTEGRVLVFHNGVIGIRTKDDESDTQVFVRDVMAHLPSCWWDSPALRYLVNEAIGYSKLTLMTATETVNLHESRGEWDGGIWYSSEHRSTSWFYPQTAKAATAPKTPISNEWGHYDETAKVWVPSAMAMAKRKADAERFRPTGTVAKPTAAIIPYKSARDAAIAFGLDAADERDVVRTMDQPITFRHGGHTLQALIDITLDADSDYEDAVLCETCHTIGTVYVIDGQYWIDMAHVSGAGSDGDEDDLIPGFEQARVTASIVA